MIKFIKNYIFIIFALLPFFFSDLQLRFLVTPKAVHGFWACALSYMFTILIALTCVFFCSFILGKKTGKIVYSTISSAFVLLSLSQYLYFKIAHKFFWLKSLSLAGEATPYIGNALQNIDGWCVFCTLVSVFSMVIALLFWKKKTFTRKTTALFLFIPLLCIVLLHIYMSVDENDSKNKSWDLWNKPRVVYSRFNDINKCIDVCGLEMTVLRDISKTILPQSFDKTSYETALSFFEEKDAPQENSYSGIFEGKNLITVMMESMDTWVIDPKYTPTLCYMMENGINFTNYHSPFFGEGYTFNVEFSYHTGFVTPRSEINATAFTGNSFPHALPNLFKEKGYSTNSYHFNNAEFYNRGVMHEKFGYEKYHSLMDFGLSEYEAQFDSNALKTDAVYESMTASEPFYDFFITYTNHLPYDESNHLIDAIKEEHPELVDENMDKEQNTGLILASSTDNFFKQLLTRLHSDGLLENTVIIGFTDHYTYGFNNKEKYYELKDEENLYRVPAFIYCYGQNAKEISKPMMPTDWIPTIANLFALRPSIFHIGGDILAPENGGFVFFDSSRWLDKNGYFDSEKENYTDQKNEYIAVQKTKLYELINANDAVVKGNFFANKK